MKAQSGKTGKGGAGQKPRTVIISGAEYERFKARERAAKTAIANRKPGQRANMAKNRAAAAKKRGK